MNNSLPHFSAKTFSLIFFFSFLGAFAQNKSLQKANKNYEKMEYVDAIAIYERFANEGYKDENVFKKLANCFYFNAEYVKAERWYGELFKMKNDKNLEPEYYFRYGHSLKACGKVPQANRMMWLFKKYSGAVDAYTPSDEKSDYLQRIEKNSGRYDITTVDFNTESRDFGSAVWNDKMVFSSSRDNTKVSKKTSQRDKLPYNSLFFTIKNPKNEKETAAEKANTKEVDKPKEKELTKEEAKDKAKEAEKAKKKEEKRRKKLSKEEREAEDKAVAEAKAKAEAAAKAEADAKAEAEAKAIAEAEAKAKAGIDTDWEAAKANAKAEHEARAKAKAERLAKAKAKDTAVVVANPVPVKVDVYKEPEYLKIGNEKNRYNESTATFTKDGKTVYFTRNDIHSKLKDKDGNKLLRLKIYTAQFDGKNWSDPVEVPFNSNEYNTAHPCLSKDDSILFFVSDMPGSLGESDIFYAKIDKGGKLSEPKNAGPVINTPQKETFPYSSKDGEFYFASNGHPGLGGLDVFISTVDSLATFKKLENVGKPLNSGVDDFGIYIDSKTRLGYFSSNRDGGKGLDDLYAFLETRKMWSWLLKKTVVDKHSKEILPGAKVSLLDSKQNVVMVVEADSMGNIEMDIPNDGTYTVKVEKAEYLTETFDIAPPKPGDSEELGIERRILKVKTGDNLADLFDLGSLYFDFGKWNITKSGATQLQKIYHIMKQYPKITLRIESHTDSRASSWSNMTLSDKRARSMEDFLIKKGINGARMKSKGFGESRLVNECSDGVKCTEEQHAKNRRVEMWVDLN